MPYSDQEMHEIERDPVRLKAYFWHMIQHWRRMGRRKREKSKRTGEIHPVTNYRCHFENGREELRWAEVLETCADVIERDIDSWVEGCLIREDVNQQFGRDS